MRNHDPSGTRPDLQCLLDKADGIFREMNELIHTPNPDFAKLKELDEEGRRLADQMAAHVSREPNFTPSRQL